MAPPEKKQKVEEEKKEEEKKDETNAEMADAEAVKETPKEAEELEKDEAESRARLPKIKETVAFYPSDTTLNLLPVANNNILTPLTDGGMHHFFTGARSNVGISKGRYMFEAKIIQKINVGNSGQQQHQQGGNRRPHQFRIGFSAAKSPLVLGSSTMDICFESEGNFLHNGQRTQVKGRFDRDMVVAVVLNLDKDSSNFNTISLFRDGARVCQPQALPESLKGQTLYPHVSFKGVSVHVNFGPSPLKALPFKCRMVQDAVQAESAVVKAPAAGKSEVLFPVSLPDEGTFDWADMFLEKNPNYVELSDRMILDWAAKSGIWTKGGHSKTNNDKPEPGFQIQELDNGSVRKTIYSIAPLVPRNYVVMEVKGNLVKEDRSQILSKFDTAVFKRTATVMVGEPSSDFTSRVHEIMLKEKQEAETKAFESKKLEEKRKKIMAKKQKEIEKAKKKAEKKKQKDAEAAKRKIEAIKRAKEAKEKGEEPPEEEEVPEEPASEEEPEEEEPEEVEEQPPTSTLTDEEKKQRFRSLKVKDLTSKALSMNFVKFSVPAADEGFDEIKCEWIKTPAKAAEHIKTWISDKKLTTRVEDIKPSDWFQQRLRDWQSTISKWNAKTNEYKTSLLKKAQEKAAKESKAKAKAAAAAAAKAKREAALAKGEEVPAEEEKTEEPEEMQEEEEEPVQVDDVFAVEDVMDVGGGKPLFYDFVGEDWTMMTLRFELHLLAHAFKRDCGDDERLGIFLDHLPFYYNRYFKKHLNVKDYGVDSLSDLVALVQDAVFVAPKSVIESQINADLETPQVFCKLTELARRHRQLLIAIGDESAKLNLTTSSGQQHHGGNKWHGGGQRNWQQQQHHQRPHHVPGHQQAAGGWQGRQKGGAPAVASWPQQQQGYGKVIAPGRGVPAAGITPYGGGKMGGKGGPNRWVARQ